MYYSTLLEMNTPLGIWSVARINSTWCIDLTSQVMTISTTHFKIARCKKFGFNQVAYLHTRLCSRYTGVQIASVSTTLAICTPLYLIFGLNSKPSTMSMNPRIFKYLTMYIYYCIQPFSLLVAPGISDLFNSTRKNTLCPWRRNYSPLFLPASVLNQGDKCLRPRRF